MANVGHATLTIIPSAKGFQSLLQKETGKGMDAAGKKGGSRLGGAIGKAVAPLAALAGAAAIGNFFKNAISAAGDFEQSVGAIDAIFKGNAGQMHEWAKGAAVDVGLTKNEFNELGTLIGAQLKNGGTAMDELAPKTNELIGLGADLSSMFGGTTAEAVGALSSALKGERDPIEKYGVSLKQAQIDAEAAALGFEKVGGSLSAEAQQAATLSLIMKQTSDAHGNFARETNTLAHQQQVLGASWGDLSMKIGTLFVPALTGILTGVNTYVMPALDRMVTGLQGLKDLVVNGDYTGALRDAFGWEEDGGAVDAILRIRDAISGFDFGSLLAPLKSAFSGMDFGAIFAPVGEAFSILGPTIASLLPTIVQLVTTFSPFGIALKALAPIIPTLATALSGLMTTILGAVTPLLPILADLAGMLVGTLGEAFAALAPAVTAIVGVLGGVFATVLSALSPLLAMIGPLLQALLPPILTLIDPLLQIVMAFMPLIEVVGTLIGALLPPLVGLLVAVIGPVTDLVATVAGALVPILTVVAGVISGVVVPIISTLIGWVVKIIAKILEWAGPIIGGLITAISAVIGWIGNIIAAVVNFFTNLGKVGAAIEKFKAAVSRGIEIVKAWFAELPGRIVSALATLGSRLLSVGRSALDSMKSGVTTAAVALFSWFSNLPGDIVSRLGDVGSRMISVGKNIIDGLIEGIKGAVGRAVQAVKDAVGNVIDGAKNLLGIASPSKVFRQIGAFTAEGMALGIADGARGIQKAADAALIPSVPSFRSPDVASAALGANRGASSPLVHVGEMHVRDEAEAARQLESRFGNALTLHNLSGVLV